jgi:pilus assembly protein CpaE
VLLGQSHAVVVDVPRVAAVAYRWVLDNADFRVIVADQTLQSARDATRLRAMLPEGVDHRNLLVINRGGEAGRRAVPIKEMESVLGLRPNLVIPYEPAVFAKATNAGTPPAEGRGHFPNGIAALAATLSGREAKRRGWWRRR